MKEKTDLCPINLKIRKGRVVEFGQNRHLMRILVDLAQIFTVLLQRSRLVPALRHARVVLPFMEQLQMRRVVVVQMDHGEKLVQVRYVAAVDDGAAGGFRRADRVLCVHGAALDAERHGVLVWEGRVGRRQGISRQVAV